MFLSKKTPLVAVDMGSHSIKLAQLKEIKGGNFELVNLGIKKNKISNPQLDSEILLCSLINKDKKYVILNPKEVRSSLVRWKYFR